MPATFEKALLGELQQELQALADALDTAAQSGTPAPAAPGTRKNLLQRAEQIARQRRSKPQKTPAGNAGPSLASTQTSLPL